MSTSYRRSATQVVIAQVLLAYAIQAASAPMTFVMENFPPFNYSDNGVVRGPLPTIVRTACAAIGAKCQIEMYPWRRAYRMAQAGLVDGIFVLQRLPERENDFYFTEPVIQTSFGIFARTDSDLRYESERDLNGLTIGVYGPSATSKTAEEIALNTTDVTIVTEVDNYTVLRKLANLRYGMRGVAVMNSDVGAFLIREGHHTGLRFAGPVKQIAYAIGLSRHKLTPDQAKQFIDAVHRLMLDGTVSAIDKSFDMAPPQ